MVRETNKNVYNDQCWRSPYEVLLQLLLLLFKDMLMLMSIPQCIILEIPDALSQ